MPHDYAALVLLGALVVAVVYLTVEIQGLRAQIEPLTSSGLARGLAAL
jgi:hypothetical protein